MEHRLFSGLRDAEAIFASRRKLTAGVEPAGREACEGGCGVIGIIGTDALPGRLIIRSCEQMRNRGNGKGGGIAAVGLFPEQYKRHYALHVAYLDPDARAEVERKLVEPAFDVALSEGQPCIDDHREVGLEITPPAVVRYFVTPRDDRVDEFAARNSIADRGAAADEFVFQNSFRLNRSYYSGSDKPRAFVLSQGRDLMILKAVGYAEQVARYYRLDEVRAHVWIGHQRYPTRGRVWHPGGAHPFAGLNEALVHNGDFANYHAVTEYLRQRGIAPLFVTDTEVSALLFDLYSRVLRYPIEYVIEALAPTPEGDFERLSKQRQRIYRALQMAHLHGSPDGPWFFIIARSVPATGMPQLIGITDVSMLRPQVFALQSDGERSLGAIGSEKQAIDAFFEEVCADDPRVLPLADKYWVARGGSCTDGGAFIYTLDKGAGGLALDVRDKFGNAVTIDGPAGSTGRDLSRTMTAAFEPGPTRLADMLDEHSEAAGPGSATPRAEHRADGPWPGAESSGRREEMRIWGELAERPLEQKWAGALMEDLRSGRFSDFEAGASAAGAEIGLAPVLRVLTYLHDRQWDPGNNRRAALTARIERVINSILDSLPGPGGNGDGMIRVTAETVWMDRLRPPPSAAASLVIDASDFSPEGDEAACRAIVSGHGAGWRNFVVYRCQGDRFVGCGLGPATEDVRIDVYGSSGDYLGSGLDGGHIHVHGDAQDQVGQILKSGRIVVHGSVGQTFLYGAKGGEAYVMGNAAGRPLINAVGRIRAIINGTSLDYCAESFMAGRDVGDGFVIINGVAFDRQGRAIGLENKYPGNNLFSLASGGACYLNDPYNTVKPGQLNGAEFAPFRQKDWNFIVDYLRVNEALFGLSIRHDLLMVDGVLKWPKEVFRKVVASHATSRLDWSSMPD